VNGVRPLPGVRFETQPPPPAEVLPRMDVAALVGFAERGPIGVPVPVADPAGFAAVFGDDLELALDPDTREPVSAYLAPAVRAFFRNGGRRCHVIRVADTCSATACTLDVPGLLRLTKDRAIERATLPAGSPGSWADGLRVSTAELVDGLELTSVCPEELACDLILPRPGGLVVGDVVRIGGDHGQRLVAAVAAIEPVPSSSPPVLDDGLTVRALLDPCSAVWMTPYSPSPLGDSGIAAFIGNDGIEHTATGSVVGLEESSIVLELATAPAQAPGTGALVEFSTAGAEPVWLTAAAIRAAHGPGFSVVGEAWSLWTAPPSPPIDFGTEPTAERVTFELRVAGAGLLLGRIADLGFAPDHPFFVGDLPDDDKLYSGAATGELAALAAEPRFPLAGGCRWFHFPFQMSPLADVSLGARREQASPLRRDGLDNFGAALFVDGRLAEVGLASLMATADAIRSEDAESSRLKGIHAVLDLDEVTLVAVPDAVHRGWTSPGESRDRPPPETPSRAEPPAGFVDCSTRHIGTPELAEPTVDEAGTVGLSWTPREEPEAEYVVSEAPDGSWTRATEIPVGPAEEVRLRGRSPGLYAYRVRAVAGTNESDWSDVRTVVIAGSARWELLPAESAPHPALLAVQRAALRMCAARGDLFAALSLPGADRDDAALAHVKALRAATVPADFTAVPALDPSEERALSYGAVYHPWPTMAADDTHAMRRSPRTGRRWASWRPGPRPAGPGSRRATHRWWTSSPSTRPPLRRRSRRSRTGTSTPCARSRPASSGSPRTRSRAIPTCDRSTSGGCCRCCGGSRCSRGRRMCSSRTTRRWSARCSVASRRSSPTSSSSAPSAARRLTRRSGC
jgi:hypothetical protein